VISKALTINETGKRRSAESVLAKLHEDERSKLRVYIGAAPGVGKTYQCSRTLTC
jgi:K+-sensing histidine kinase KdpD